MNKSEARLALADALDKEGAARQRMGQAQAMDVPGDRLELAIADWSSATMTTLTAIKDLMVACEEETRASIVKWIAAAPDRMDAQKSAGAKAIHHMHEIGLRTAASDIAESIRTRADLMEKGVHRDDDGCPVLDEFGQPLG